MTINVMGDVHQLLLVLNNAIGLVPTRYTQKHLPVKNAIEKEVAALPGRKYLHFGELFGNQSATTTRKV